MNEINDLKCEYGKGKFKGFKNKIKYNGYDTQKVWFDNLVKNNNECEWNFDWFVVFEWRDGVNVITIMREIYGLVEMGQDTWTNL